MKSGGHPFFSLPYPSMIRKRCPFTAGSTESFPVVGWRSLGSSYWLFGDFLHHNRDALNCSTAAPLWSSLKFRQKHVTVFLWYQIYPAFVLHRMNALISLFLCILLLTATGKLGQTMYCNGVVHTNIKKNALFSGSCYDKLASLKTWQKVLNHPRQKHV